MNSQALVPLPSETLNCDWGWGCSWSPPPTPTLLTMKESSDPFGTNWSNFSGHQNENFQNSHYFSFFSDNFGKLWPSNIGTF